MNERDSASKKDPAIKQYNELWTPEAGDTSLESLRFFCSLALSNQDWLDVEPFFDAVSEERNTLNKTIEQLQREKAMLVAALVETGLRWPNIVSALECNKKSTDKWMAEHDEYLQKIINDQSIVIETQRSVIDYLKKGDESFEILGYIEPRKNFEFMETEDVYIVGEKDFDGCAIALYRRKE